MKITLKSFGIMAFALLFIGLSTSMFAQEKKENTKKAEAKHVVAEKKQMCNSSCSEGCCTDMKGLSDDQKQKMKSIDISHQKDVLQLKNQIDEKRSHLRTLETADNADMTAIDKTIDEISAFDADMMKKCAAHKQSIRAILTTEQRIHFDSKEGKMGMKENGKKMHKTTTK